MAPYPQSENSALMRYLEEALAESYAQCRVNVIGAIREGISFPITEDYVTTKALVTEGKFVGRVVLQARGEVTVIGGTGYYLSQRKKAND